MFAASSSTDPLISAIRDQTEGLSPHMVFVIDIVSVRFGNFTPEHKAELERFEYLQMLTLNDCGIKSLENFPHLPRLIRLDLVFNEIKGESLEYLRHSKHLQTLMLGANKIEKLEHLAPLKTMKKLLQLDLINNPVSRLPGFRNEVLTQFPSILILDTLDRGGKDAYTNATMIQAVARVPDNLFDKSRPPPPPPKVHVHAHEQQKKKLSHALARTGSIDSVGGKAKPIRMFGRAERQAMQAKKSKMPITGNRTKSSRAGLVFPVGRIRRHLKSVNTSLRIGSASAVYMAAILEYLTAELLQVGGNEAKRERKQRITPLILRNCLKYDDEMNKLLNNVTFGTMAE